LPTIGTRKQLRETIVDFDAEQRHRNQPIYV